MRFSMVLLFVCFCLLSHIVVGKWTTMEETKLVGIGAGKYTQLGAAMALSGDYLIAGGSQDETLGALGGAAYIFHNTGGTWSEVAKVTGADVVDGDYFGTTVDIDGDTICAGTWQQDLPWSGNTEGGSMYVFSIAAGYTEQAKLTSISHDSQLKDHFGFSVSISGLTIAVGCEWDEEDIPSSNNWLDNDGSVYVFTQSGALAYDWASYVVRVTQAVIQNGANFGTAVALDGNRLIVGAGDGIVNSVETGFVSSFLQIAPSVWTQQMILSSDDITTAGDGFGENALRTGTPLSISGLLLAAGAYNYNNGNGAVLIFAESSLEASDWTQRAILTASEAGEYQVGSMVHLVGDTLVTGAPFWGPDDVFAGRIGAAYLFRQTSADVWEEQTVILADDGEGSDYFGASVVFHEGNGQVLVGAYWDEEYPSGSDPSVYWNSGALYVYATDIIDDCIGVTCEHGGACTDLFEAYECICPPAYGGEFCTDCLCENGGVCQDDDLGIGYCDCTDVNYSDDTCSKSCNNGVGETYPDTGCNCTLSGATGKFCTKDVDDCKSSPCANGATCTDNGADFFPDRSFEFNCSCGSDSPYMGPTCEDTICYSSPCLNDGTCVNGQDFACNCTDTGYEGEFCQTEIDECASSPCVNDGDCTDLLGDFACDCTGTGYEGKTCSDNVDECMSSPCHNGGTCTLKNAFYKCTCTPFWEGDNCEIDVDDCLLTLNECLNGGACEDDPNVMGDVICTCIVEAGGFTGKYCDVPIEDACVTFNPCFNGGKCILDDITEKMSCDCRDTGYEGDVCDVQVYFSECVSSPCMNGGQCYDPSDQQDDFYCVCDDTNGYFGDLCELTACDSMPCQNGGSCTDVLGGDYICTCAENYSGAQCQDNEDEQVGVTGADSSSSSGSPPNEDDKDDSGDGTNDSGDLTVIIIVVVVIVVLAVAVGAAFMKQRNPRKFVMPT